MSYDVFTTPAEQASGGYVPPPPAPGPDPVEPVVPVPAAFVAPAPPPEQHVEPAQPPTAVAPVHGTVSAPVAGPSPAAGAYPDITHTMPTGHTVTVADPRTLSRLDRRDLSGAINNNRGMGAEMAHVAGYLVINAFLARLVRAWSYPMPIPAADPLVAEPVPGVPSVLDQIPGEDDEALSLIANEAYDLLFPGVPTPDTHEDPKSPSEPSGE